MPNLLVLFDGVCNLCHGAVQWIIEHDRRRIFRFASLQSRVAKDAIEEALGRGFMPQSIVLIENGRVLTESDAVIAIAAHLGIPWSLAKLGRILPKTGRDAAYCWVARNRYRWFGRQTQCLIPTPEIRERFLDANEPPAAFPDSVWPGGSMDEPVPAPRPAASAALSTAHRWLILYFFLQIFPFPAPSQPMDALKNILVPWFGKQVFGLDITVFPNGSGDTTYNYVEVMLRVLIAGFAALVWSARADFAPVTPRIRDIMNIYVRYFLAGTLLEYGWDKVFPVQMPKPNPTRLMETFGESSPMGLLWTFIGASSAYEILGGVIEVLGGFFLLWRRTVLLGAIISAAVMANVVALNFCYDVPVKLFSSHLLLMAIYLIAPHAARLSAVLVLNLPAQPKVLRPIPITRRWLRRTLLGIKTCVVALFVVAPVVEAYQYASESIWAPPKPWDGTYRVESLSSNGVENRLLADSERWLKVGIDSSGRTAIRRADGTIKAYSINFDTTNHTASITSSPSNSPVVLQFRMPDPAKMELEGLLEGKSLLLQLKRLDDPPLMTRGFHWINEFPYNR